MGIRKTRKINEDLLPPVHPGEILAEEFMAPLSLSANKLAILLSVPGNRISQIIAGRRSITADTAYRLAKCFGTSVELWLNLQSRYELEKARYEHVPERVEKEVRKLALA